MSALACVFERSRGFYHLKAKQKAPTVFVGENAFRWLFFELRLCMPRPHGISLHISLCVPGRASDNRPKNEINEKNPIFLALDTENFSVSFSFCISLW